MIDVSINMSNVFKAFSSLSQKQMPFAMAMALSDTAKQAQKDIREKLPKQFKLRNKFFSNAIRYERATKLTLQSIVGVRSMGKYKAEFAKRQQEGGIKSPRSTHLAIPTQYALDNLGSNGIIPGRSRAKKLLNKPREYFKGKTKKGYDAVFRRLGGKAIPVYMLHQSAHVDERLHLDKTVDETVKGSFDKLFFKRLDYALRTAR